MRRPSSVQGTLRGLHDEVISCKMCPRLVAFRSDVARQKRPGFEAWTYWGKPVPGFGDPEAQLLIVGLAPAAHGGNRTGRVFTGDRSGDFLVRALHIAGFANQPTSTSRDDGLRLEGAYITAAVKCAPPENKPSSSEIANCSRFLDRELDALGKVRAILCLGQTAHRSTLKSVMRHVSRRRPIPRFHHGLEVRVEDDLPTIFSSYHPSPRNTQTGKLTERMFMSVLYRIKKVLDSSRGTSARVYSPAAAADRSI